jgi:hypothetical protein
LRDSCSALRPSAVSSALADAIGYAIVVLEPTSPLKEPCYLRIWDPFDTLGIRNVPVKVETALRDLVTWEDRTSYCETVNGFLQSLLDGD